jgi:hypothetical protein
LGRRDLQKRRRLISCKRRFFWKVLGRRWAHSAGGSRKQLNADGKRLLGFRDRQLFPNFRRRQDWRHGGAFYEKETDVTDKQDDDELPADEREDEATPLFIVERVFVDPEPTADANHVVER